MPDRILSSRTRVRLRSSVPLTLAPTAPPPAPPPAPSAPPPAEDGGGPGASPPSSPILASTLLDTTLAPPSKKRQRVGRSDALPKFQRVGGNEKVWQRFVEVVRGKRSNLVMLHGPHGCGKSRGLIEVCNTTLGMHVYEVNAANVLGVDETVRKISSVCQTKTLLGPRAVLLDDIEGFDETYISAFTSMIKRRKEDDGLLVVTCCDPFARSIVGLRAVTAFERLRMYEPTVKAMAQAAQLVRTDVCQDTLRRYATDAGGNFHQLDLRLRMHTSKAQLTSKMKPDAHVGLFDTTQQLVTRAAEVEDWIRSAEGSVLVNILANNAVELALRGDDSTSLERASAMSDFISSTCGFVEEEKLHVLGLAARSLLKVPTGRVPALRLAKHLPFRAASATDLDTPALLRSNQTDESAC